MLQWARVVGICLAAWVGGCGLLLDTSPPAEGEVGPAVDAAADATLPGADASYDGAAKVDGGGTDASLPADGGTVAEIDAGEEVVAHLDPEEPLRSELPCGYGRYDWCYTDGLVEDTARVVGEPGREYDVSIRVRGVVEDTSYLGGTKDGHWHVGGTYEGDTWNVVGLNVDAPGQSYFLNSGVSDGNETAPIDYVRTIRVAAGGTIRVYMDDLNGVTARNYENHTVPDIAPYPEAFDGQFVQVDVLELTAVP